MSLSSLQLGQLGQALAALAGGVVDVRLALGHGVRVLLEGHQLALLAGPEQHQVLQQVLVRAVLGHQAVLQVAAEGGEELLVLLPVVFQQLLQLGLDPLLQVGGDELQLPVMLEHLTGDVQAQVLGIHNALDEAEVLRQQVLAVLHDQHAGGVELQPLLVLLGVEVVGRRAGIYSSAL